MKYLIPILLTIISVCEVFASGYVGSSFGLWFFYGAYKFIKWLWD